MKWKWGQKIIDRIRGKRRSPAAWHRKYGKIYYPYYNMYDPLHTDEPKIFNADGQPLRTFFIRDIQMAHEPYCDSKYFFFDRFNFCLDTHFYSHWAMLEQMGKPTRKYGILCESAAKNPEDYLIFDHNPGLEHDFDAIFTYSEKLLDKLPNAKFMPFCAKNWLPPAIISPEAWRHKTRNCSILASNKKMCPLNVYRIAVAEYCKTNRLADTFGTFDGGPLIPPQNTLTDYCYSIVIENDRTDFFFTEKIINCFAAMTVPIYCGARKITNFFNGDGIIAFSPSLDNPENIKKVLSQCSFADYQQRLEAIKDNFIRSQKFFNPWDYMYENYFLSPPPRNTACE